MSDTTQMPGRIWAWKEDHGDVWTGEWSTERDADHVPYDAEEYSLVAAAPQPAPVDREALVEVIREALREAYDRWAEFDENKTLTEYQIDALLARGLRLPGEETMAWAVVGDDGAARPDEIRASKKEAALIVLDGERIVRVAIRVVEGGDDAA